MLETLTLRNTATAGLLALVAVQAARVAWAAAAPIGPVGEPVALPAAPAASADFAMLGRYDPFYRLPASMPANGPAAGVASFRLYAVRAAGGGKGSAIIAGPDGKQASFMAGSEIAPGVTLVSVDADRVVLATGGRRSSLSFPAPATVSAPAYTPPEAPAPPPVQPVSAPAEPQPMPEFLAAAGLQPGDTVTSIARSADGQGAVIQYQRDGEARTATLGMPSS